jgi:hypothetical protein
MALNDIQIIQESAGPDFVYRLLGNIASGKAMIIGGDSQPSFRVLEIADVNNLQTNLNGKQASLGFTAENVANKENTTIDTSATKYPTVNLLKSGLDGKANTSHSHAQADVTGLVTALSNKVESSLLGAANGVATLGADSKVPASQLPASVTGAMNYQGSWNASTNTPTIPTAGSTNKGHYYVVSTNGSTNVSGITDWKLGDWIVSNGTAWEKIDNTDSVTSVASKTGAVTLVTSDITGLDTALSGKQATITGGATTIVSSNLTINKALVSDASGKVAVASTTATELSYLVGVTSAIQTQINTKMNWVSAPVSATATGTVGQVAYDNDYIYICVATNVWKRMPIATW